MQNHKTPVERVSKTKSIRSFTLIFGSPALTLYFDNNSMEDLWLSVSWGK